MSGFDSQQMLLLGTLLFLLGLLTGVAVPWLKNRRMGLSSHLVGVQHGIVLWAVGLMQPRVDLSPGWQTAMSWSMVLGLYGLWLAMLLAAVWGASRALPMAGAGHQAAPAQETTVTALVYAPAVLIIAGTILLLTGLW